MTKITFLNKKTFISELNKYAALYGSISCPKIKLPFLVDRKLNKKI